MCRRDVSIVSFQFIVVQRYHLSHNCEFRQLGHLFDHPSGHTSSWLTVVVLVHPHSLVFLMPVLISFDPRYLMFEQGCRRPLSLFPHNMDTKCAILPHLLLPFSTHPVYDDVLSKSWELFTTGILTTSMYDE
uniref:Ovule protein n=1 Tax=Steinernema glaseri TaxID=37863 RepID=A0A1I7YLG0_9BILA